jgi:hypothetical protein
MASTMIWRGGFNGVAVESAHGQGLCSTGTIRQRSGSDQVSDRSKRDTRKRAGVSASLLAQ